MSISEVKLAVLTVCPECGGRVARGRHSFDVHVGRRTVAVEGDYLRCEGECAEFYFAAGEMDAAMIRASAIIRTEEGLLTPEEIRALRRHIGLTQPQFEHLLGVGAKTVTRWEKGTVIQNGATDTLLRLIRDVPQALQHLLKGRDLIPHVHPLVPATRAVSYRFAAPTTGASPRQTSLDLSPDELANLDNAAPQQITDLIA